MMLSGRQQPTSAKKVDRPRLKYRSSDDGGPAWQAAEHLASNPRLGQPARIYHNQDASAGCTGQPPSGLQHAIGAHHDR